MPWWSFGKAVLATAALALVAAGHLTLDDPLPGRPYSLRHLLQHRSGLPDYGEMAAYHEAVARNDKPWSRDDLIARLQPDELVFLPGDGWSYSNIGYMLVRELIEGKTGLALDAALSQLVFEPLDIGDVTLARTPDDLLTTAWGNAAGYHPGWVFHGLLVGPASRAVLLLHRLLAGRLLPPALLAEMRLPHRLGGPVPGRPWLTAGYGLGLMIGTSRVGQGVTGHTGGGPGSTAAVYQSMMDERLARLPQPRTSQPRNIARWHWPGRRWTSLRPIFLSHRAEKRSAFRPTAAPRR